MAAVGRAAEAFDRTRETITAIAERMAGAVGGVGPRAMRPDRSSWVGIGPLAVFHLGRGVVCVVITGEVVQLAGRPR